MKCLNISKNSSFERYYEIENVPELCGRKIRGFIDCYDNENNIIYEFKCVRKLENIHYIQLAIYMFMNEMDKIYRIEKIDKEIFEIQSKINYFNEQNNSLFNLTHDSFYLDKHYLN